MATITKEIVETVIKYSNKFPQMTTDELSRLCGISRSSVCNVLNGMYNRLLEEDADGNTVKSEIPYATYRRLVLCEIAIDEMLANALRPNTDASDTNLFLSYRKFSEIIQKHFPERYEAKVKELQEYKDEV